MALWCTPCGEAKATGASASDVVVHSGAYPLAQPAARLERHGADQLPATCSWPAPRNAQAWARVRRARRQRRMDRRTRAAVAVHRHRALARGAGGGALEARARGRCNERLALYNAQLNLTRAAPVLLSVLLWQLRAARTVAVAARNVHTTAAVAAGPGKSKRVQPRQCSLLFRTLAARTRLGAGRTLYLAATEPWGAKPRRARERERERDIRVAPGRARFAMQAIGPDAMAGSRRP